MTYVPHRWIYELIHDRIREGLHVLHECDNAGCVSLQHLSLGTQKLNMEQMVRRRRLGKRAVITYETAAAIRQSLSSGVTIADTARQYRVRYQIVYNIAKKGWR